MIKNGLSIYPSSICPVLPYRIKHDNSHYSYNITKDELLHPCTDVFSI